MEFIEIKKIKVKENIRKNYGDLTELISSIKQHGIRKPVELNSEDELIDGHRRVLAALKAGLSEVPYFYSYKTINKTIAQIISGIFSKDLNPIEEGRAFKNYIDLKQTTIKVLARRISKPTLYVERRIKLMDLPEKVQQALINKKILLGHALLLSKLTMGDSLRYLREIISNGHSVQEAKENLEYHGNSKRLSETKFDKTDCKECQYNGSVQTELFETGRILTGNCLNPSCFIKKTNQFIKDFKKKNKDILFEEAGEPQGFVNPKYNWELDNNKITPDYVKKCRKEKKNYLVKVDDRGHVSEFVRIPGKKKATTNTKEADLGEKRKAVLGNKVADFKRQFLITKSAELMKPGAVPTKALTLINLIASHGICQTVDKVEEILGINEVYLMHEKHVKALFAADSKKLDKAITVMTGVHLWSLDARNLVVASKAFGVDMKLHFVITEEFLELHTKDQLIDLAKELKIKTAGLKKKPELVSMILKEDKGKVPREVL